MAYTKSTLTNIIQSIADRHDSGIYPTKSATISYWTRLINRGVLYCAELIGLTKTTELTTVSGTIALPDDFMKVQSVYVGNIKMSPIAQADSAEAQSLHYWITGNHTDGFSINTTEDRTLDITYHYRPAPLVNNSDVCVIPNAEAVVAYTYYKIRMAETDPLEDAEQALNECNSICAGLIDTENINDGGITMTIFE